MRVRGDDTTFFRDMVPYSLDEDAEMFFVDQSSTYKIERNEFTYTAASEVYIGELGMFADANDDPVAALYPEKFAVMVVGADLDWGTEVREGRAVGLTEEEMRSKVTELSSRYRVVASVSIDEEAYQNWLASGSGIAL